MKNFLSSKINWTAIILLLVSLQDFIGSWDFGAMTTKSWTTFALSILIMIFRTFYNNPAPKTE